MFEIWTFDQRTFQRIAEVYYETIVCRDSVKGCYYRKSFFTKGE